MDYAFNFAPVLAAWPELARGTLVTLQLTLLATLAGFAVAVVCAWLKTAGPRPLRLIVNLYIEVIRNTPFLVQLLFFYFALPSIGLKWSPHTAALVALVVNLGAYATEIVRAGIEAIPRGQIEAGRALNLSPLEIFRYIVFRPALKTVYPALTSQFILLMLSTSVVSVISAEDLMSEAANLQSRTFRSFEIYLVVALIYLALTVLFSLLFRLVERLALNFPTRAV